MGGEGAWRHLHDGVPSRDHLRGGKDSGCAQTPAYPPPQADRPQGSHGYFLSQFVLNHIPSGILNLKRSRDFLRSVAPPTPDVTDSGCNLEEITLFSAFFVAAPNFSSFSVSIFFGKIQKSHAAAVGGGGCWVCRAAKNDCSRSGT